MSSRGFWKRVLDRALTTGLAIVILGLVSVQLFDVAGMAVEAYGLDAGAQGALEGGASGIVAPVLQADLGSLEAVREEPRMLRASIWLAPIASLRGCLGIGWLERVGVDSDGIDAGTSRRELRLRLGGGLMAPLTPSMGVDLHAGA